MPRKAPSIASYTSDPKLGRKFKPLSISVPSGAGGFNPLSISGLQAWYDFSDIGSLWKDTARTSAVTADADIVKGVTDKSGTGNHLSEATNGPAYKAAIQNSRSVLRFDGVDDQLATGAVTISQPDTVALVAKIVVDEAAQNTEIFDGNAARQIIYKDTVTSKWSYFAGSAQTGSVSADTSYHTHFCVFNGASSSYRVDLASNSTANPSTGALTTILLGFFTATRWFNVEIAEVLVYNTALGTTNRDQVEAYLKAKWATP